MFYMIIADFKNSIRENLEIVDFNLTLDEAREEVKKLKKGVNFVKIIKQGEKI